MSFTVTITVLTNHHIYVLHLILSLFVCFFFYFQSLSGNDDRNSEVKHLLYGGLVTRYLRILPVTHHGGVCMRTELFGVKKNPGECRLIISVLYCCGRCDGFIVCTFHIVQC